MVSMLYMASRLVVKKGLLTKVVDEEVLVHDPQGGFVHILNQSAARILQLCDGSRYLEALVQEFSAEQKADPEVARGDVVDIITEFERLGLLSRVGPST